MKQIKLSRYLFDYPVGEYISSYIPAIEEIASILKIEFLNNSITFWCMGSSGAMLSALTCQYLENCNIFHVKKENEDSHSRSISTLNNINIIIDDSICSGNTIKNIYLKMKSYNKNPDCVIMTGDLKLYKFTDIFHEDEKRIKLVIGGDF